MASEDEFFKDYIVDLRSAFFSGSNVIEISKKLENKRRTKINSVSATLVSYDLQAGSYIKYALQNPKNYDSWVDQVFKLIEPLAKEGGSILELGVGEATTLAGVLSRFKSLKLFSSGFDLSWSRLHYAQKFLTGKKIETRLFVGDLLNIPLRDNSFDIVYSSHSLEPNSGMEAELIREAIRVSRKWIILIEPIFELSPKKARQRMKRHGYVKNLHDVAKKNHVVIHDYKLLDFSPNPDNPSGVLLLEKQNCQELIPQNFELQFTCPVTKFELTKEGSFMFCSNSGLAYPVLKGIPMLRSEHAIVASKFFS